LFNPKEMDIVNREAHEEAAQDYLRIQMDLQEQHGDAAEYRRS